jgi:hypothetical protein
MKGKCMDEKTEERKMKMKYKETKKRNRKESVA